MFQFKGFLLILVTVNLQPIPDTSGKMQEHTVSIAGHHAHTFTPTGQCSIDKLLMARFWRTIRQEPGENPHSRKGKHAQKLCTDSNIIIGLN